MNSQLRVTNQGYRDVGETVLYAGLTSSEDLAGIPSDFGRMLRMNNIKGPSYLGPSRQGRPVA